MQLLSLILILLLPSSNCAAVTTLTITAISAAPTRSPSSTFDTDFQRSILNSTNTFRDQHNASALAWNNSLADNAAKFAKRCRWKHSGGPNGENLAKGFMDVTSAVDAWGNERAAYNFHKPGFSKGIGHFTQLVWKNTSTVGCGRAFCNGQNGVLGWLLVCEYFPRGNVVGQFPTEVQGAIKGLQQCTQGAVCNGVGGLLQAATIWKGFIMVLLAMLL